MHRKEVLGVALMFLLAWPTLAQSDTGNDNPVAMKVSAQIGPLSAAETQAIAAATVVMHEYMAAFNSRDPAQWADTLLFPHVRISSGGVVVHPARDEFVAQMDFAAFAQRNSWQRSAWDYLELVQVGAGKVHIAVRFTRYDPQQQPTASFDSLYVLQPNDSGDWGIRARSSFAP